MKSAQDNILDFLKKESPAWYAVGQLERMEFKNADNTLASGKSINRRCQELREEGKLEVDYRGKNHAYYRASQSAFKVMKKAVFDPVTGTAKMVEVMV
jgi:hypothetical protein